MVSCVQRIVGITLIFVGLIIFVVLLADAIPFTEFLAVVPIFLGVKIAFPGVGLPKLR